MRRSTRAYLQILTFTGTASLLLTGGCSSDNNAGDDGGYDSGSVVDSSVYDSGQAPDTGSVHETGVQDTSTHDTGIAETGADGTVTTESGVPEAAGDDGTVEGGGHPEAGEDGESPEAGQAEAGEDAGEAGSDGGETEAGEDGGPAEAGTDGGQTEAGEDSGALEAGSDGGQEEAGEDGGTTVSFANPLQIDVSSILNVNTIVTSVPGGIALTAMDGSGGATNYDLPTQAAATKLTDAGGVGLPNNGLFTSNGTTIPNVQLAWNDDGVHPTSKANSIVISGTAGTAVRFNVPAAKYDQVQIYATGGNGAGSLSVTLNYSTGAPVMTTMTLPDWCGSPGTNEYLLGSKVGRVQSGTTYNGNPLCGIWAIDLSPDTTRSLVSVSIMDTGAANSYFVFYGATAW